MYRGCTARRRAAEGATRQLRKSYKSKGGTMPGARTHDIITGVTGLALIPVGYSALLSLGLPAEATMLGTVILAGAHMLSGIMFSTDLDIDSAIDNRWGIFFWIWRPYMWLVPHRSRLFSHGLVIPQLLR